MNSRVLGGITEFYRVLPSVTNFNEFSVAEFYSFCPVSLIAIKAHQCLSISIDFLLHCSEYSSVFLSSITFLAGLAELYLVLPSFTAFQRVSLNVTGFYRVFTGF